MFIIFVVKLKFKTSMVLVLVHKGTYEVRILRLQFLTNKFESLKMLDEETIADFNVRLSDIASDSFILRVKMQEKNMAPKILRSSPKRFDNEKA